MPFENFLKQKIRVTYTTSLKLASSDKSLKSYEPNASSLIKEIVNATDQWDYEFAVTVDKKGKKDPKVDRIKSITYPQLRNGHQGEGGHTWQWQLDTESMGKGSKERLYLDKVSAKIKSQSVDSSTIKIGKEDVQNITCVIEVSGSFSADTKH